MKKSYKKIFAVIGVMTGTSMDGIDISLLKTNGTNYVKVIKERSYRINIKKKLNVNKLQKSIKKLPKKYEDKYNDILKFYLERFIRDFQVKSNEIDLISISGQTIYHNPEKKISIQLGSGSEIANKFRIKTISNLRDNDIINGGQGAPIGSYYHRFLLNSKLKDSIIINLGGVANFSLIHNNVLHSSDIGPANCILDDLSNYFFDKKFDKNGKYSSKGKINLKIIDLYNKDIFFKKSFPKSLDRNYFHKYIKKLINIDKFDAMSTAVFMTIIGIEKLIKYNKFKFNKIIFTGGGRKNKFLINSLKKITSKKIEIIEDYNINGDLLEAQMFGYIGVRSYKKLIISNKNTTGVQKAVSGGVSYLPS